jgi:hypothetical protein
MQWHQQSEQLGFKKKIKDLKNRTKTKANAFKREARKTGGGENEAPPLTATEEKLLSFVGIDSVDSISGGIDTFRESGKYTYANKYTLVRFI